MTSVKKGRGSCLFQGLTDWNGNKVRQGFSLISPKLNWNCRLVLFFALLWKQSFPSKTKTSREISVRARSMSNGPNLCPLMKLNIYNLTVYKMEKYARYYEHQQTYDDAALWLKKKANVSINSPSFLKMSWGLAFSGGSRFITSNNSKASTI